MEAYMKHKLAKNTFQQGDVIGRKLTHLPTGEPKIISCGRCVLAHGESGHSHFIEDDEAELIRIGERMLLKLTKAATVQHEEHGSVRLSRGIWEIGRVKEFDWLNQMERQVVD
jgi:hypothetical protein